MSGFVEQLRLAEKVAEDIYFAKVSRELIEALHQQQRAEKQQKAAPRSGVAAEVDDGRFQSAAARDSAFHGQ
jgi:hypothetical protein